MDTSRIFELAVKNKYRFPYKGSIATEDLWDLDVNELDKVFKTLNSKVKVLAQEESLLTTKSVEDTELTYKIEIVRHIVNCKLIESANKLKEKENKEQAQKIMSLITSKEENELANKSKEELMEMLAELQG